MYTEKQISEALTAFDHLGSITAVIRQLGYPSRTMLYNWLKSRGTDRRSPKENIAKSSMRAVYHATTPLKYSGNCPASVEMKLEALRRCFENGENVSSVAMDIGYSRNIIYMWRKIFEKKGLVGLMPRQDHIPRRKLIEKCSSPESSPEIRQLQEQIKEMQMDIDILKETIAVLKKDPGVDLQKLRNREKAVIVDAKSKKYSLPTMLKKLSLPKSSYYYCRQASQRTDKYIPVRNTIAAIFSNNYQCYGYRRIKAALRKTGVVISEKVVRRLMKEKELYVLSAHKAKYASYRGEISPEVPNLLKRDFHAEKLNQKWLTDITEFAIPAGKVYLSAIIDCYDGGAVSWNMGTNPDAELANKTLDKAIKRLSGETFPILHSDRGCHYRWPGWIALTKANGLIRSMSKKGCSPDNAACEGFFGRLKNECFYNRDFAGYTPEMFISYIGDYIKWYNESQIKSTLGYLSPKDFRELHLIAA